MPKEAFSLKFGRWHEKIELFDNVEISTTSLHHEDIQKSFERLKRPEMDSAIKNHVDF